MPVFSSWKKKDSPSNSAPANALASSSQPRATQQLQFPTKSHSQSNSQSPQEKQQSQAIYPCQWSVHTHPSGPLPSPFFRNGHTLSTRVTSESVGEMFLFGGRVDRSQSPSNDLYVISTRDFSTTLFKTSGDVPNPRYGHCAVLARTLLFIWGGKTNFLEIAHDDSLYLLDLGTSDLFDVKSYSS
jgi:hypothetical protein